MTVKGNMKGKEHVGSKRP